MTVTVEIDEDGGACTNCFVLPFQGFYQTHRVSWGAVLLGSQGPRRHEASRKGPTGKCGCLRSKSDDTPCCQPRPPIARPIAPCPPSPIGYGVWSSPPRLFFHGGMQCLTLPLSPWPPPRHRCAWRTRLSHFHK